jgi:hypothetical protein
MKKNILAIGIISLLIGIAILPICTASTNENVSDEKPLTEDNEYKFFRLRIEGTVTGLQKYKLFGISGGSPIDITAQSFIRGSGRFYYPGPDRIPFTAKFVRWSPGYPYEDPEQPGLWHVKGVVYFWHST